MNGCWARYVLWGVITVLGVGHLVSACGQRGELYLPEPTQDAEEERQDS